MLIALEFRSEWAYVDQNWAGVEYFRVLFRNIHGSFKSLFD